MNETQPVTVDRTFTKSSRHVEPMVVRIPDRAVEIPANLIGVGFGFLLTTAGVEGYVINFFTLDLVKAAASFAVAIVGAFDVYESVTGELGRRVVGKPRKHPIVFDRIGRFMSELPEN